MQFLGKQPTAGTAPDLQPLQVYMNPTAVWEPHLPNSSSHAPSVGVPGLAVARHLQAPTHGTKQHAPTDPYLQAPPRQPCASNQRPVGTSHPKPPARGPSALPCLASGPTADAAVPLAVAAIASCLLPMATLLLQSVDLLMLPMTLLPLLPWGSARAPLPHHLQVKMLPRQGTTAYQKRKHGPC